MLDAGEGGIEPLVTITDGRGAVDVRRRADAGGDARERNSLAMKLAAGSREPRLQYAFAQTASVLEGLPHFRQLFGASADWNSSSGRTRIVALVSALISASQPSLPQKPA